MRWESGRRSTNIEDRRGLGQGAIGMVGGGGIALVVLVLIAARAEPARSAPGVGSSAGRPRRLGTAAADPQAQFVAQILGAPKNWGAIFSQEGAVSASGSGACSPGRRALGVRYRIVGRRTVLLSGDQRVYLDLTFFDECNARFGGRRFRAGVRHRARSRPSRAERHGRHGTGPRGAAGAAAEARAVGAPGTAGRLLRRRLGEPREPQRYARSRRHRGSARRRDGDR